MRDVSGSGVRWRWPRRLGARLVRSVVTAAVTCLPVAVVGVLALGGSSTVAAADVRLVRAATEVSQAHPGLVRFLVGWQEVFLPWHVYLAAVPVAAWVYGAGLRGRAVWGVVTMLVGWNLGLDVKLLVQRARPLVEEPVAHAPGYSFPSGHAFNTALAACTCLVIVWPLVRGRGARAALTVSAAALVAVTAADRVFLGVHYPTDVAAGVLLAVGLVAASWAGYTHRPSLPQESP